MIYKNLIEYHKQIGLWNSPEKFKRYGYVLSPSKFVLTENMQEQLIRIGRAVYAFQNGALKLAKIMKDADGNHARSLVNNVLQNALGGLPFVTPNSLAPLCKVDLMVDVNGNLKIAEIDAYNPRAIAYATFLTDMHLELGNITSSEILPGVMNVMKVFVEDPTLWVYAHRERYYGPILENMARVFMKNGIPLKVSDPCSKDVLQEISEFDRFLMVPWGMQNFEEQETKAKLIERYSEESFLYPLFPWMGTKGLLGLISEPYNDGLSELVKEFFGDMSSLKSFLPETILVSKKSRFPVGEFIQKFPKAILKASMASGMKGVWMNDVKSRLDDALQQKNPTHVLQNLVEQKKFAFQVYDQGEELIPGAYYTGGNLIEQEYYVRLTAHVDYLGNVVDVQLTGRTEPDVHGAPDCILLPCVLG